MRLLMRLISAAYVATAWAIVCGRVTFVGADIGQITGCFSQVQNSTVLCVPFDFAPVAFCFWRRVNRLESFVKFSTTKD